MKNNKTNIYMVFSPINRCGKSLFSISLAQKLAKLGKTLLVTFDEYEGVYRQFSFECTTDLSDIIHSFNTGNLTPKAMLNGIYHFGDADYIAPARYPSMIKQTTDILNVLNHIGKSLHYQYIVVDVGANRSIVNSIIESKEVSILMPVLGDWISQCKVNEYKEFLITRGFQVTVDRIKELYIPYDSMLNLPAPKPEDFAEGDMGKYVSSVLDSVIKPC